LCFISKFPCYAILVTTKWYWCLRIKLQTRVFLVRSDVVTLQPSVMFWCCESCVYKKSDKQTSNQAISWNKPGAESDETQELARGWFYGKIANMSGKYNFLCQVICLFSKFSCHQYEVCAGWYLSVFCLSVCLSVCHLFVPTGGIEYKEKKRKKYFINIQQSKAQTRVCQFSRIHLHSKLRILSQLSALNVPKLNWKPLT
jgi:hypothetical protein